LVNIFSALSNEAKLKYCSSAFLVFGLKDKINGKTGKRDIVGTDYKKNGGLEKFKKEISECVNNKLR